MLHDPVTGLSDAATRTKVQIRLSKERAVGYSKHLEDTRCSGFGEPTVEKTDPSWRLESWGV